MPRESSSTRALRAAALISVLPPLLFAIAAYGQQAPLLMPKKQVQGTELASVSMRAAGAAWHDAAWDDLERGSLEPGRYEVRFQADGDGGEVSLEVPHCAGRDRVALDGHEVRAPPGPLVVPLAPGPHEVLIGISVSPYERRIACGDRPRIGAESTVGGFSILRFASPSAAQGGGSAVVYLPPGRDLHIPAPLLVGLHPWNGSIWTYAAYAPLLREARARGVTLLMPSGLGNSLYTADAEDEVIRAIHALSEAISVDEHAVSLWGASMGGAGATTIGFHHPDRFASVTSFFGDSKYDLSTYVRAILPNEAAAHLVNALDVVDNARELSVWLIHGEKDRTSPIRQSELLASAMRQRGWRVRFDRVPEMGHSGALVARFLPEVVAAAVSSRVPDRVSRVTYRSVHASDTSAYGVRVVRAAGAGDATVDVERRDDAVHVLRAEGVRAIGLSRSALCTAGERAIPIVVDEVRATSLDVRCEP
jgi:pimeloyl-ACP methyl ester carboxylesterase